MEAEQRVAKWRVFSQKVRANFYRKSGLIAAPIILILGQNDPMAFRRLHAAFRRFLVVLRHLRAALRRLLVLRLHLLMALRRVPLEFCSQHA